MPTPDFNGFEEALSAPDLTPAKLRSILVEAAGIPATFTPDRIFTKGLIRPDIIGADFEVPRDGMGDFMQVMTETSVASLRRMKVFPLGTPNDVDRFRVELQVGRRLG